MDANSWVQPGEALERWLVNRECTLEQLTQPPVVLGGCGRSGTTLLLSILSAHEQIFAIPVETHCLCPTGYANEPNLSAPIELGEKFYRHFDAIHASVAFDRWCEKTPRNVLFFNRIIEHFDGRVRLIQILRDGRDVVTSRHPVKPEAYWVSVERWVKDVQAGLEFIDHPLVHTVRYEDLIRNNEAVLRGICDFLALPWTAQIADWHKHALVREDAALGGEVKPLFESSIGKWRSPQHEERIEAFMANADAVALMKTLNYV